MCILYYLFVADWTIETIGYLIAYYHRIGACTSPIIKRLTYDIHEFLKDSKKVEKSTFAVNYRVCSW